MDFEKARQRLAGCYVTVPTLFRDDAALSLNLDGIRRHVGFLIEGGLNNRNAVFLAGGAAGDFSTMTFEERLAVAAAVVEAVEGRVAVAMGAQTTSTMELRRLARAARDLGADYIQVSCPFYFQHSEEDFYEYAAAAAEASDVGIIVYNTFWTSTGVSTAMVSKLAEIPNVVGLKWATPHPGWMTFEQVVQAFSPRFSVIDNQMHFVASHMLGARGFEVHVCNYWPQWGARPDRATGSEELFASPGRAVAGGSTLYEAVDEDRAGIHGRRRLPGQAVPGVGGLTLQPLSASHPRRQKALPGGSPSNAHRGRSTQGPAAGVMGAGRPP